MNDIRICKHEHSTSRIGRNDTCMAALHNSIRDILHCALSKVVRLAGSLARSGSCSITTAW